MIRLYVWLLRRTHRGLPEDLRLDMAATFVSVLRASSSRGALAVLQTLAGEFRDLLATPFRGDPLTPPPGGSGFRPGRTSLLPSRLDWKNAVRRAAARPVYSAVVVGVLALGIAINTVVFSVADSTLFRGLPYPNGARLVEVFNMDPAGKYSFPGIAPATFAEWRAHTDVFDALEGWNYGSFIMLGGAEPRRIGGAYVTPGLFRALGVSPVRGQGFEAADGEPGRDDRVIISDSLWRTRFGSSNDAIGQRLVLNDRSYTVVGVMPPHFRFPASHQLVWLPTATVQREGGRLQGLATLREGLTREVAQARLDTLGDALMKDKSQEAGWRIKLGTLRGSVQNAPTRRALQMLTAAVLMVLLIACANLANLGFAQALARRRELAVRAALGASRIRLVRELLAEYLLLGLVGGTLGLGLASWGVQLAIALAPAELTLWTPTEIRIDDRILAFTAALTLASAFLFGILPAWRASRTDAGDALKTRTPGSAANGHLRAGLVVVEVTLSVVLLIGAALLMRSFARLTTLDPGFDAKGLTAVTFEVPADRYPGAARRGFLEQVGEAVRRIPGVTAVSIANGVPPSGGNIHFGNLEIEGHAPEPGETVLPATSVDFSYLSTLRIPVVAGRTLAEGDPLTAVVVSESLARKLAGSSTAAVGSRFRLQHGEWYTVVGVAREVHRDRSMERETPFEMYYPIWRSARSTQPVTPTASRSSAGAARGFVSYTLAVRAAEGTALALPIKQAVWSVDSAQPVGEILAADALLSQSLSQDRFAAVLMGTFATLALLLAAAGLYAVLAQLVGQRRQEIGIRIALGASVRDVARLVVGQGIVMTATGITIGVLAAWASTRLLANQLYGVTPHDAVSFTAVPLLLLAVSLAASWLPARRALSVDPVEALRTE